MVRTLFLLLLVLAACTAEEQGRVVRCADLVQGCRAEGIAVFTDVPPGGLRPFRLTVEAGEAREVRAEFVMTGMAMGINRYRLQPVGAGRFQARLVLPVCATGRRDWILWVTVDGRRVGFAFEAG